MKLILLMRVFVISCVFFNLVEASTKVAVKNMTTAPVEVEFHGAGCFADGKCCWLGKCSVQTATVGETVSVTYDGTISGEYVKICRDEAGTNVCYVSKGLKNGDELTFSDNQSITSFIKE